MLKGKLGWKGERGYSAYEIAVQHGYEGSEQDWLATLGTSSHFEQDIEVYTTTTIGETIFALPTSYTSSSFVEVYVNGMKLTTEEYTLDAANERIILNEGLEVIGTQVEVVLITMSTNNLPITDTITSESTNDTAAGTKSVYDALQLKTDLSKFAVLTGSVPNTELSLGGKALEYPEGFTNENCVVIAGMKKNHTTSLWNSYLFMLQNDVQEQGMMVQLFPTSIKLLTLTDYQNNRQNPDEKYGYDYRVVLMKIS